MPYNDVMNQSVRPLNKGMIKNLPSNGLPNGSFLDLNNFRAREFGLERRGGYVPFTLGDSEETDNITYTYDTFQERIQDLIYYWKVNDSPEMLLLSDRQLYTLAYGGSHQTIPLVSTGLTISDFTVEDLGAKQYSWNVDGDSYDVITGDYIRVTGEDLPQGQIINVEAGTGTISKIFVQFDTFVPDALTVFDIVHVFQPDQGFKVDWTVLPGYENKVLLTDGRRPIMQYDGVDLKEFVITNENDDPLFNRAKCIAYFADRIWYGNVEESGQRFHQRIRWSNATDFDSVNIASYIDLPYSDGELIEILPMGSLLVLYFEDALYIGRPTNLIGQPYYFERLETGNVGIVSQQSVAKVLDGHFFIGQDDIYYFSGTSAIQRIGTPILIESLDKTRELNLLWACQIAHDPLTDTIAFLMPDQPYTSSEVPGLSSRVWRFNYKTQAWSYDSLDEGENNFFATSLMSSKYYLQSSSWQEWIELWPEGTDTSPGDNDGPVVWRGEGIPTTNPDQIKWNVEYSSWDELGYSELTPRTLFVGLYYIKDGIGLQQVSFETNVDSIDKVGGQEFIIYDKIETPDYDFGFADTNKILTRISLKMLEPVPSYTKEVDVDGTLVTSNLPLRVKVYVSNDRGQRWKRIGEMKFFNNTDESRLDFRSRGTNLRFKFVTDEEGSKHKPMEYVFRIIGGGIQVDTV